MSRPTIELSEDSTPTRTPVATHKQCLTTLDGDPVLLPLHEIGLRLLYQGARLHGDPDTPKHLSRHGCYALSQSIGFDRASIYQGGSNLRLRGQAGSGRVVICSIFPAPHGHPLSLTNLLRSIKLNRVLVENIRRLFFP